MGVGPDAHENLMLEISISADAQAILLLCTTLGLPRDVKPLSLPEWNLVAAALSERRLRPGALLGRDTIALTQDAAADAGSAERMARLLERGGQLALELERFAERGIWALTRADSDYPRGWKQRLKQSAPVVVFGAGPRPVINQRAMAIVGSRDVDEAGLAFARRLAIACVDAGLAVVSGGARGTDAAAVTQCLESQGRAYAVLADGLEQTLQKREMIAAVRGRHLTFLSVQHPAAHFSVGAAMGRNKLIYCLSDWATVVSTSAENGGTWAGATENLQRGWVPLFVRDEPSVPEGNRRVLGLGARSLGVAHIASGDALTEHLAADPLAVAPSTVTSVAGETTLDFGDEDASQPAELMTVPVIATGALAPIDPYAVVLDHLVAYCGKARTVDEVAAAFSLEPTQAKAWLTRAVSDMRLRKLIKPVRYQSSG